MQLSTDLPYGKGIGVYLDSRGESRLPPNITISEEERTRILRPSNILERSCLGCGRKFLTRRDSQAFHSEECHAKATEKNAAKGIVPTGWKLCAVCDGPFLAERDTEKYCKRRACARQSARTASRQSQAHANASQNPHKQRRSEGGCAPNEESAHTTSGNSGKATDAEKAA